MYTAKVNERRSPHTALSREQTIRRLALGGALCLFVWLCSGLSFSEPSNTSSEEGAAPSILESPGSNVPQTESLAWKEIVSDLHVARRAAFSPAIVAPEIILFKSSLKRFKLNVLSATELGSSKLAAADVIKKTDSVLAINASFFDTEGRPLGLVLSRGLEISSIHRGGQTLSGVFQVGAGGSRVVHRDAFSRNDVVEAVQAGPRLLVKGGVTKLRSDGGRSHRSGVCTDQDHNVIIFASTNWPVGITLAQLQSFLRSVGCYDALNLDGGGSRQLAVAVPQADFALSVEGEDLVPVFLTLQPIASN